MDTRKNDSQNNDENSGIKGQDNHEQKKILSKSYCPEKRLTYEEMRKLYGGNWQQLVNDGVIRTDSHNIRYDETGQYLIYLPKDHPEYREHPEPGFVDDDDYEKIAQRFRMIPQPSTATRNAYPMHENPLSQNGNSFWHPNKTTVLTACVGITTLATAFLYLKK